MGGRGGSDGVGPDDSGHATAGRLFDTSPFPAGPENKYRNLDLGEFTARVSSTSYL